MSIFRALLFAIIAFINIACSISCSHECYAMEIEHNLEIYAFDTGQANFIIMRHGDNAYIVDAGGDNKTYWQVKDDIYKLRGFYEVRNELNGANLRAVFITHPHTDHYNLLNAVLGTFNETQKQNTEFYLGGTEDHYKWLPKIQTATYHCVPPRQSVEVPGIDGLTFRIIQSTVPTRINDKNTYSYMLLVTYNGRNILFGGDYILKKDLVSSLGLPKLDIVFLPHHGSVRTSSEVLVDDDEEQCEISDGDSITEFTKATIPSLYFICGGYNTNVRNTKCFYNLEHLRNTVVPHDISMNSPTKGKVHTQADNQTTRPLFATQNALLGFYGILINHMNGSIEMYGVNGKGEWETPFEATNSEMTFLEPTN